MEIIRKHFSTIDSTNTWAKQHAHELNLHALTLISADHQTAGRGRFKRHWFSPFGLNIYATFCFFIEKHREDIGNLPQVLAVAASHMLEDLGFHPQLKWPNDILLSNKKVAGILCETTPLSDQLCIILGIGININMPKEQLEEIDRPATSLFAEDGNQRNVQDMLKLLQTYFLKALETFIEDGFSPFLDDYKNRLFHTHGDLIHVSDQRTRWEGTFQGITQDGALELQTPSGTIKIFRAGEIVC